jgi:hypothetical protein
MYLYDILLLYMSQKNVRRECHSAIVPFRASNRKHISVRNHGKA